MISKERIEAIIAEANDEIKKFGRTSQKVSKDMIDVLKQVKKNVYESELVVVDTEIEEYRELQDLADTPCVDLMTLEQKIRHVELYSKHKRLIDLFYDS